MKPPFLVNLLDLFGSDIPLQIFGEHKKKSLFGALMGFASIGFIVAVTIYFITTLFSRDTKQIITNQDTKTISKTDLTNVPIMFTLTDQFGFFIPPDPTVWSVTAWNYRANYQNTQQLGFNYTFLEVHPCTGNDIGNFSFYNSTLSASMCIPIDKQENILNSIFADTTNGWNTLQFFLTKCDGNVNPNCKNRTYVDSVLEGAFFAFTTLIQITDNDNATNPSYSQAYTYSYPVSSSLYKETKIKLTQNVYTDDNGFIFESLTTHNFYTLGDIQTDYSLVPPVGIPGMGSNIPVTDILLNNSPFVLKTKRTFLKAQAVLANVGGIIKFIMVFAQTITHFVNRRRVFIQIANEVFQFVPNENKSVAESAFKINVAQKNEYNFIEIEGRTEKVIGIKDEVDQQRNTPNQLKSSISARVPKQIANQYKIKIEKNNQAIKETLTLSLSELICFTFCIKNKRAMKQYEMSEKAILEKVSIHSIIQDSYRLDNLSKHVLDSESYRNWRENKCMSLIVDL